MNYDDFSSDDPLNGYNGNFNIFLETYFSKGMPCIFSNGGLKDMKVRSLSFLSILLIYRMEKTYWSIVGSDISGL